MKRDHASDGGALRLIGEGLSMMVAGPLVIVAGGLFFCLDVFAMVRQAVRGGERQ